MIKTLLRFILIICITSILITLLFSCSSERKRPPQAQNGVLDLRNWDFGRDGNVPLDGDWQFYWNEFLKSKDFDNYPKIIEWPKKTDGQVLLVFLRR